MVTNPHIREDLFWEEDWAVVQEKQKNFMFQSLRKIDSILHVGKSMQVVEIIKTSLKRNIKR